MKYFRILWRICRRAKDNELLALELLEAHSRADQYKRDAEFWKHEAMKSQGNVLLISREGL